MADVLVRLLSTLGVSSPREKLQLMRNIGFSRAFLEDAFSNPKYSQGWINLFRQDIATMRKTVNACKAHFGDKITKRILMKLSNPEIQSARRKSRLSQIPTAGEIESLIKRIARFHAKMGKPVKKFPAFFSTHLNTILAARNAEVELELMHSMWKHKIDRLKASGLKKETIESWLKSGTKRVIRWFDAINPEQIEAVRRTLSKHHLIEIFPVIMSANMRGTLKVKEARELDARINEFLRIGKGIGLERARRILAQQPHFFTRNPESFRRLVATKMQNQPRKPVHHSTRKPRRPR